MCIPRGPDRETGRFIMRESKVLRVIRTTVGGTGGNAVVLPFGEIGLLLPIDMLHRTTDFPSPRFSSGSKVGA